jgi:hypothetical protein
MNVENIQKVRDVIASAPATKLDMSRHGSPSTKRGCGTAGCIIGWANTIWPPASGADKGKRFTHAYEQLGLDFATGQRLALGDWCAWEIQTAGIKKDEVLSVLDHLIETGEVNWTRVGHGGFDQ